MATLAINADGSINAVVTGSGSFEINNDVGSPVPVSGSVTVIPPSSIALSTQSAANTAVTLTLPAVAGQFHYITSIELRRANTSAAAVAAAATNLAYSTTNLNGLAVNTGNAIAAGTTIRDFEQTFSSPIKSTTAGTATTITAPAAGAGVQTQIIVTYYTAL